MDKTYPVIYDQRNYPDPLGTSKTATIKDDGCFVTAFAMKACFYGHTINPSDLNKLFTNFNGKPIYINDCLLPDNGLSQVYSDIKYVKTLDYEPIPTDLATIKNLLADANTTVTIRINLGNNNLHFVEAVSCDGNSLHIANPWGGQIEDFTKNYGNPVTANLHVIVYTGTPANQTVTPSASTSTPLATTFNNAITKSSNFDVVANYLGITPDQRVTTSAGAIVVEMIKQLQTNLANADAALVELQKVKPVEAPTVVTVVPTPENSTIAGPMFSGGTQAVASTPATQVPTTPVVANNSNFIKLIWKTLVFWLG